MGLERVSAVLQHVNSNYEIDLFQSLLNAAAKAIGCANEGQASLKVVADHIRSCGFLIADGVTPSNEGRGYVLRRIIRRACRHGNKLGAKGSFFYQIVAALVAEMGDAFPELKQQQAHIERVLKTEEEQFAKTLEQGLKILEQDLAELKGTVIPGDVIFKLYDTFGFPMDLTGDIALLQVNAGFASPVRPGQQLTLVAFKAGVNGDEGMAIGSIATTISRIPDRYCADQNNDGVVTPADFNGWIANFNANSLRADTNGDGAVTAADFNAWIIQYDLGSNGQKCLN